MADPTSVNRKVADSTSQANEQVLGNAPAQSLAAVYQSMAQSVALSMQNAVAAQQQMQVVSQAVTAQAVQSIMGIDLTNRRTPQPTTDNELLSQVTDLIRKLAHEQDREPT